MTHEEILELLESKEIYVDALSDEHQTQLTLALLLMPEIAIVEVIRSCFAALAARTADPHTTSVEVFARTVQDYADAFAQSTKEA